VCGSAPALSGCTSAAALPTTSLPDTPPVCFSPNPVSPPSGGSVNSTLTVTTTATTPTGTSTLTITGTSGSLTHSTTVDLVVQPPPDFSVSAPPPPHTVTHGNSTTSTAHGTT